MVKNGYHKMHEDFLGVVGGGTPKWKGPLIIVVKPSLTCPGSLFHHWIVSMRIIKNWLKLLLTARQNISKFLLTFRCSSVQRWKTL